MTEPTYAELIAAWKIEAEKNLNRSNDIRVGYARAVLAKWGAPPAMIGEPVFAFRRKGLDDFCTCTEKRYEELSLKPKLFETRIFYTTPQPTQAQAGAVPLTDEQWQRIADLTDSILTRATKDEIERVIGIKGGQHG